MAQTFPTLASLPLEPYLVEGELTSAFDGQVGIYAIFDEAQSLQYVGYSRDIGLGLKQHLVRCPSGCHWVKGYTVTRPSRTLLDEIRAAWLREADGLPPGNGPEQTRWEKPIDAKQFMTEAERHALNQADPAQNTKLLKQLARRVEADVKAKVEARGASMALRFNPKLKEQGLLDLK